jgi:hypothetical protein
MIITFFAACADEVTKTNSKIAMRVPRQRFLGENNMMWILEGIEKEDIKTETAVGRIQSSLV